MNEALRMFSTLTEEQIEQAVSIDEPSVITTDDGEEFEASPVDGGVMFQDSKSGDAIVVDPDNETIHEVEAAEECADNVEGAMADSVCPTDEQLALYSDDTDESDEAAEANDDETVEVDPEDGPAPDEEMVDTAEGEDGETYYFSNYGRVFSDSYLRMFSEAEEATEEAVSDDEDGCEECVDDDIDDDSIDESAPVDGEEMVDVAEGEDGETYYFSNYGRVFSEAGLRYFSEGADEEDAADDEVIEDMVESDGVDESAPEEGEEMVDVAEGEDGETYFFSNHGRIFSATGLRMFSEEAANIEEVNSLLDVAVADGELDDEEKEVIKEKAADMGIDEDQFEDIVEDHEEIVGEDQDVEGETYFFSNHGNVYDINGNNVNHTIAAVVPNNSPEAAQEIMRYYSAR